MAQRDRTDIAISADGRPLPLSGDEVRRIVLDAVDTGELLAAIFKKGDGLMIQVFGPPSEDLMAALDVAADAYRKAWKGATK